MAKRNRPESGLEAELALRFDEQNAIRSAVRKVARTISGLTPAQQEEVAETVLYAVRKSSATTTPTPATT